jgi:hypothetical protein
MRRSSSTIPFGYKLNSEDKSLLDPVPEQLEALDKIVPMIKDNTLSLREGSLYIEHVTGRSLSHEGLKKIASKYE